MKPAGPTCSPSDVEPATRLLPCATPVCHALLHVGGNLDILHEIADPGQVHIEGQRRGRAALGKLFQGERVAEQLFSPAAQLGG